MGALDEGLMATRTHEERDVMHAADARSFLVSAITADTDTIGFVAILVLATVAGCEGRPSPFVPPPSITMRASPRRA
ncbi:MAG: hypothetical protein EBT36_13290 [Betaproteobacteria bacterium]|nr:hypothetical protein [Betaproteobacteria bacterium]